MRSQIDPLDPPWRLRTVELSVRWSLRRVLDGKRSVRQQRVWAERLANFTHVPRGLERRSAQLGGRPAEIIAPRGQLEAPPRLLYLHGGGWVLGSASTARPIAGGLAKRLNAPVLSLDYRLAPEHPFPAAPEDVYRAYLELRDHVGAAAPLGVAGDSAGGNMAVGLAVRLKQAEQCMPSFLGLISPGADFSVPRIETGADALMTADWVNQVMDLYVGKHDPADPRLSCALADLRGLPPTLIQVASTELLRQDAEALYTAAQGAQVPVQLEVYEGLWHDFQIQAGLLRTADRALDALARFGASIDG